MTEIGRDSIMKRHSVTVFFVLTFLISLCVMVLLMLTGIGWLGLLAASGSSIAALITAALTGNLKWLLSGFLRWRCNPLWYGLAIFIPGVTALIAIGLSGVFGTQFQIQWTVGWAMLIPTFLITTVQAGLGEEIGWRGFATPKLMEKRSALTSSLIVGVVWASWHIPLYFVPGTLQNVLVQTIGFPLTLVVYSLNIIAFAIVWSWIYEVSNRNLWLPILIHGATNSFATFFAISNLEVYGIAPIMISALLWIILAVAVVLVYGPHRLSRSTQ
ncbi:CPBP family intramembrane glutamic endopeptidase [Chloroflexota bacterium]